MHQEEIGEGDQDSSGSLGVAVSRATAAIAARRELLESRLTRLDERLVAVRSARRDWTDEEHDPEGFVLTHEWSQAEGAERENRRELAELDSADKRVAAGTYGICAVCDDPIPFAQLERFPTRTACVSCASGQMNA